MTRLAGVLRQGSPAQCHRVFSACRPGCSVTGQGHRRGHTRSYGDRGFSPRGSLESLKVAVCPNGTKHGAQVERAGSSQERSSHRADRGPWRGRPLQACGPGAGVQALPHLRRSSRLPSGSRARTQCAGNMSAAPGTAATVQEASRLDGSGKRGLTSADLGGLSRDRSPLLGSRSAAVGFR
ncbi:hypothetical protein NDU88_003311 [Pleurodeles waltl]|uniref:Uncharacterized protein n=1 Tax=Pleurodeles waltl TaxID=8319 RepID=A0AAV7WNR0_PLEWA|nr:hypothetical protein NDU88_003311 [Pleurodeles waltl]